MNPEFLFPELSKQKDTFVSLMKALSIHLRPAPYPYGLLTLRLLGKLGGKNRRVLRHSPSPTRDVEGFDKTSDISPNFADMSPTGATKLTLLNPEDRDRAIFMLHKRKTYFAISWVLTDHFLI